LLDGGSEDGENAMRDLLVATEQVGLLAPLPTSQLTAQVVGAAFDEFKARGSGQDVEAAADTRSERSERLFVHQRHDLQGRRAARSIQPATAARVGSASP
jgi:hypothetical protein